MSIRAITRRKFDSPYLLITSSLSFPSFTKNTYRSIPVCLAQQQKFSKTLSLLHRKFYSNGNNSSDSNKITKKLNSFETGKTIKELRERTTQLKEKFIPPYENIYTIPNILTATRLIAAPAIGYFVLKNQINIALPLFIYSCVTDFIDGFIARKYNLKTIIGSILDPMADKLLLVCTTILLAVSDYAFPHYLAALILGKDIAMGLLALVVRYKTLPLPKSLSRFWDFSIPSVRVFPTTISKWNTAFQMVYITLAIMRPGIGEFMAINEGVLQNFDLGFEWFGYFVGSTTVLAAGSYIWTPGAIKKVPTQAMFSKSIFGKVKKK